MEEGKFDSKLQIGTITLSDNVERKYIDSYDKLYRIVDERFKEQKKKYPDAEPIIDLSRLKIKIGNPHNVDEICPFDIKDLYGRIEGIIKLKDENDTNDDGMLIPSNEDDILYEVKYKISFEKSILYSMQFKKIKYLKFVNFKYSCFFDYTNVTNSIFLDDVDLSCIDLDRQINDGDKLLSDRSIYFTNLIFKKNVHFNIENWNNSKSIKISNNTFEGDVNFIYCQITDESKNFYDFTHSEFKGKVLIHTIGLKKQNISISQIEFSESYFHKGLLICGMQIGNILMRNCHFDDTVNISRNYYNSKSKLDFSYSTINSLFFIDSDFDGKTGESIKLSNEISFSKSLITKDALIFLRNINNGNDAKKQGCLNFEYANILGTVTIQDTNLKEIKLDKSTLIGNINIEDVDTGYDCRESIAKIKDSFLKRNDVVNSLVYKAKEMESYSNDLSKCFSCKFLKINKLKFIDLIKKYFMTLKLFRFIVKNLWSFIKFVLLKCILLPLVILPIGILLSIIPSKSLEKVREYTLLYLNRISNSFGMSWGQGVLFTCITALYFFVLINYLGMPAPFSENIPKGETCFGYLWENYLNMFYLLDFKEKFSKGIILNSFGETLFFVSKIFVSYGIYQTISAFRKYGK